METILEKGWFLLKSKKSIREYDKYIGELVKIIVPSWQRPNGKMIGKLAKVTDGGSNEQIGNVFHLDNGYWTNFDIYARVDVKRIFTVEDPYGEEQWEE